MTLKGLVSLTIGFLVAMTPSFGQPLRPPVDSSQAIADRIVRSEVPVLVEFWAAWCMPCRMLNPILEEVEEHYGKKILFIKVNVDVHRALSAYFGVNSIPAVFIINRKNVVRAFSGVQPKEWYIAALDAVLRAPPPSSEPPPASPPDSSPVVQ
jgi:thioredoxin 1